MRVFICLWDENQAPSMGRNRILGMIPADENLS